MIGFKCDKRLIWWLCVGRSYLRRNGFFILEAIQLYPSTASSVLLVYRPVHNADIQTQLILEMLILVTVDMNVSLQTHRGQKKNYFISVNQFNLHFQSLQKENILSQAF